MTNTTYFLIPEPHLSPRIPGDVHATEKDAVLAVGGCARQLRSDRLLVLLVYDVVHAVAVDEEVLLWEKMISVRRIGVT